MVLPEKYKYTNILTEIHSTKNTQAFDKSSDKFLP